MRFSEIKTYPFTIRRYDLARWFFLAVVILLLFSPVFYWLTGIGQSAAGLPAEIVRLPDGTIASSAKAEALHRLSLPMRLQLLFIYPLLLLGFQFSGGALALRRWLERRLPTWRSMAWLGQRLPARWRQSISGNDLLIVFLFVLVLELALALLYLPFSFYRGFIVAHQFGLSTQTAAGWAADWLKSLVLTLAISGLVWTGFYGLMRLFPRRWPIPAGALLFLFGVVMVLLTPVLITPLFYRVEPLADAGLRARIVDLAGRAGMEVRAVEVIDASAKTTQVNAYFTGFFGAQRIVLYDNLLAGYTPDQVEVVLAHEMGHWRYQHVLLGLVGTGAAGWLGLFALHWLLGRVWRPLALKGPADVAGLPYILAIAALVSLLAMPVENGLSRYAERQADWFALTASQKPVAYIELFEKFAVQNLSLVDAPRWEKYIFYSHPPIIDRIGMAEHFMQTGP